MTRAFTFPGQGSQQPGMCAEFSEHRLTAPLFTQANDILGFDLKTLMLEGDMDTLTLTENAQPALFLAGIAALTYLEKSGGRDITAYASHVAGHSLGEYTALTAAGALKFEDALRLVRLRGQAMQRAVPADEGAMAAIIGLDNDAVEAIASEAGCVVANDNAKGQTVISGGFEHVEHAREKATEKGAKRAMLLPVSAPFHSPKMQSAAEEMTKALADVEVFEPKLPVVMNVIADVLERKDDIKNLLIQQITGRVRWRESMEYLANAGVGHVVELGWGKVLTGLAPRCDKRLRATSLTTPQSIDTFIEDVKMEKSA